MLLISTSSLKWYWLHKIFKLVSQTDYDWINLDLSSLDFDTENIDYIKELSKEFSVPVVSISAYEKKMDKNTVDFILKMSGELWVKCITFYPPHRLDKDATWFSTYLPRAKAKNPDISITVMNTEPKTFLFFIPEYRDATLDNIKKITGETALHISNIDPESWVDLIKTFGKLGNSIVNILLSDKTHSKSDLLPGKGEMPLETLLIRLREGGYNRDFTLKVDPKTLGVGNDELVLKRLAESKKFWEKHY